MLFSQTQMDCSSKPTRHISYILDSSGSMSSMGNTPKTSTEKFLSDQRSLFLDDETTSLTLITFNSSINILYKGLLKYSPTEIPYIADKSTALYDAIGTAINLRLKDEHYYDDICVIFTDGEENSSSIYTQDDIKTLINKMKTEYRWNFVFLAANQDVVMSGKSIGLTDAIEFNPTSFGFLEITRSVSDAISQVRKSNSIESSDIYSQISYIRSVSAPPILDIHKKDDDILNPLKLRRS